MAAAAIVAFTAASAPPARAQASSPALHLLDVPYLPQSEALCGGAAVAMVMRYWGATGVYAETFSDLVDREVAGIRGEDLIRALQSRQWDARSFAGDGPLVRTHLAAGRPIVALIEDRPARFHYVVLVGWAGGRVILHDPARAPFRVMDEDAFLEGWRASGSWTLLALPPSARTSGAGDLRPDEVASAAGVRGPGSHSPPMCNGMVDEGIRLAGSGDTTGAMRVFEAAAAACPSASAPLREIGGLHGLQGEWRTAAEYARRAIALDAGDQHAWRILATSLFLTDDVEGALAAWNRIGEPRIELVNITGLERIRYDVAAHATGLAPQSMLTSDGLRSARRRLLELPAAATSRVAYRPREEGHAVVDAAVLERPVVPRSTAEFAVLGVRAISDREARLSVATPTGGGELWTAAWRWWERRPRVSLAFSTPAPVGGVWRLEAYDERQTYLQTGNDIVQSRRGAAFAASDWMSSRVRWEATIGIDRWEGNATALTVAAALQQRAANDRVMLLAHSGVMAGDIRAATVGGGAEWRSAVANEGAVWIARAGAELAGAGSPLALWPGAGTGQGRDVLLRAHSQLDGGRIHAVFGRRLVHGGAEWRVWQRPALKVVRFGPAVFVDTARAWRGLERSDTRWHTDIGAGLRLAVPGAGVIRLDVARGLRDGTTTLSLGWTR